mgnify:CR=1 FL=1
MAAVAAITVVVGLLAGLPSAMPTVFSMLTGVRVDTDPENMLSKDEPVRVFHNRMKEVLDLYDIVVVGVVNDSHPDGVFNVETLRNIYDLTQYAKTLRGKAIGLDDPGAGVIAADIIAPSTVDNIEQGGPGEVRFEWLMSRPPETPEEALAVRDKAQRIPFLDGTLVSDTGKAMALYLPVSTKDVSARVYSRLRGKIREFDGAEEYHITGLPVANDVFGVQMFKQMAISAPLAMLVIFVLMLVFFRKLILIVSPLLLAVVAVVFTMGLLVITGNTIHIMSSMIPIFIMPIAVLDSIHILSEFFDRYQQTKDRRKMLTDVMDTLFVPMLYTSLTSSAGFASLALTPIPPVQVFGLFVALGVMYAWLLTVVFIPAFIMCIPEKRLENFGASQEAGEESDRAALGLVGRVLHALGDVTYDRAKVILALTVVVVVIAGYGISQIQINDNPTRWFEPKHPIRVADRVLNEHFGGTYMAYLSLQPRGNGTHTEAPAPAEPAASGTQPSETTGEAPSLPGGLDDGAPALPGGLEQDTPAGSAELDGDAPALPGGLDGVEPVAAPSEPAAASPPTSVKPETFKQPEALAYIAMLQEALVDTGVVGKSNSLTDIVKTVHRELIDGKPESFRVPDSVPAVAQCLMQYQSSHRPGDLWHFVTPDYRTSSIWVQLKSGDNKDMERVLAAVDAFVAENPPPFDLEPKWFGLTYINVVWQDKMVSGMLQAFLGSFLVVLLMMIMLFRSGLWGLLSMIPLTVTIGFIYGVIGLIGKDYDMPVAVLSSLALGLAVDFAIHFLARSRAAYAAYGTWERTHGHVFGEPARAITRNVIVIAVGFLPLLAAPLVPYQTVGFFLASILLVSGAGTIFLLPALMRFLEPLLFPKTRLCCLTCNCGTCILTGVSAVLLVAVNVQQFLAVGWTRLTWASLVVVPVLAGGCALMSHRERCRVAAEQSQNNTPQ